MGYFRRRLGRIEFVRGSTPISGRKPGCIRTPDWTKSDILVLNLYYKEFGSRVLHKVLKRTMQAVRAKAGKLKIIRMDDYWKDRNPNWRGDKASINAGRMRARRWYKDIGMCSKCLKRKAERHHKDGNTINNNPSNIEFLCRSCHMKEDGRLKALYEARWGRK
jgi:hypothetical protein